MFFKTYFKIILLLFIGVCFSFNSNLTYFYDAKNDIPEFSFASKITALQDLDPEDGELTPYKAFGTSGGNKVNQ